MSPSSTEFAARSETPPPASTGLIVAVSAAWTASLFGYYAQAQMLGHIMAEYGQGEAAVGLLFSVENAALALATLAAAGPMARFSRARAAWVSTLVVILANVASAFSGSWEMLLVMRAIAGAAAGVAGAAGTAAAASTRDPERVFAVVTVVWGFASAAEPTLLPYATVPFGAAGGFLSIAACAALMMPLFVWLLPAREAPEEEPSLWAAPNRWLALVAMAGLFIFETGQGGVSTFIAQIGEHSGLDEYQVGNILTGTDFAGLGGGVVAAWLGGRIGRKWPIAVGLGLNVLAAVGLALTNDSLSYVILNWIWNAAYYFVVPYLMGALAAMDDLGRWVVASDGVWTLGDAAGPALAGWLVEWGGYPPLALFTLVAGLVCMVIMLRVVSRMDSGGDPPARDTPESHPT